MPLTLYKTASPRSSDEYYELTLKTKRSNGRTEEYLQINHGWWDEESKEAKQDHVILDTLGDSTFPSFADALQELNHYKKYYARSGFVHSFSKDMATNEHVYELVEL